MRFIISEVVAKKVFEVDYSARQHGVEFEIQEKGTEAYLTIGIQMADAVVPAFIILDETSNCFLAVKLQSIENPKLRLFLLSYTNQINCRYKALKCSLIDDSQLMISSCYPVLTDEIDVPFLLDAFNDLVEFSKKNTTIFSYI